ncbi:hypothetical protein M0R04_08960 [Candidatus Dojkabacteria bacterium]|jgi:hypothetical protein|nr:hypothetical protein [Candidatus Dojkabacteria bacterium]
MKTKHKKIIIEFTPKRIIEDEGTERMKKRIKPVRGKKICTSLWYPHEVKG